VAHSWIRVETATQYAVVYIDRSTVHMISLKILKKNVHQNAILQRKKILHTNQEIQSSIIVYHNYSRSKIREVAVKNTTIFVGTIIYQLNVSALIGQLQFGIQRQRKISIISIGMGGRDIVYKYMGFVVESVLEQACVCLVCTSVGLVGLGLEALVARCHNGRLK